MADPLISVIIPVYNKERYIRRAISSVLAQTYAHFELVLVDDGSTDTSAAVIQEFTDPRIRYILQSNAGPGIARNTGISESNGDFLSFLDADDEWLPGFLEEGLNVLAEHPECSGFCCCYYIGEDRKDTCGLFKALGLEDGVYHVNPNDPVSKPSSMNKFVSTLAGIYHKTSVTELGGFYDGFKCMRGEDTFLWLPYIFNNRLFLRIAPLAWYHTEASDLYGRNKGPLPLSPVCLEWEKIVGKVRPELRPLARKLLKRGIMEEAIEYKHLKSEQDVQAMLTILSAADYRDWFILLQRLYLELVPFKLLVKKLLGKP